MELTYVLINRFSTFASAVLQTRRISIWIIEAHSTVRDSQIPIRRSAKRSRTTSKNSNTKPSPCLSLQRPNNCVSLSQIDRQSTEIGTLGKADRQGKPSFCMSYMHGQRIILVKAKTTTGPTFPTSQSSPSLPEHSTKQHN